MQLENKRVIVTGATGGMGSAICRMFVKEGAKVAAFDLGDSLGRALEEELNVGGTYLKYFKCNVADRDDVFETVAKASEFLNGLDALLYLAAIRHNKWAEEWTPEELNTLMSINVNGRSI
ncbi:MAG: SDR family NAD(P)-dependent oxidoreductase [Syntrophomonas sp.]